jgi:hypothetical protein
MIGLGSLRLASADNCGVSLEQLQGAIGSVLMMAHEASGFVEKDEQPEMARRLGKYYTDAKLSLTNAKADCANDPKAMDRIHALERDIDKIGATLNVERPR